MATAGMLTGFAREPQWKGDQWEFPGMVEPHHMRDRKASRSLTRLPRLPSSALVEQDGQLKERLPRLPSGLFREATPKPAPQARRGLNPKQKRVSHWLMALGRIEGGLHLYADNNARLVQYHDSAAKGFEELLRLEGKDELELEVTRDAILFEGGAVLTVDHQATTNLIELLDGHGVRRIRFTRGLNKEELGRFVRALEGETRPREEPHIRFGQRKEDPKPFKDRPSAQPAPAPKKKVDDPVGSLLDAAAQTNAFAAMVPLGRPVAASVRRSIDAAKDGSLFAMARAAMDSASLHGLETELARAMEIEALAIRACDLLMHEADEGDDRSDDLILRIFEELIALRVFGPAAEIVRSVERLSSGRLLERMADDPIVQKLVAAINEMDADDDELGALLDRLAPYVADHLLMLLDSFDDPDRRGWLCRLLGSAIVLQPWIVEQCSRALSDDAFADVLAIANDQPSAIHAAAVVDGLESTSPNVRAASTRLLQHFPQGDADAWLISMLRDADRSVRTEAIEVARTRKNSTLRAGMEELVADPELWHREPDELSALASLYSVQTGGLSARMLENILNLPSDDEKTVTDDNAGKPRAR
jgi:hypothetical protein